MPRPSTTHEKRRAFLPLLAEVFARHGYRRATTAALAEACGVRENVLYRIWADKKAMFLDAIDYVFLNSAEHWRRVIDHGGSDATTESPVGAKARPAGSEEASDSMDNTAACRLLAYESVDHGKTGLYRLVFAGLSETDDPEVRDALRGLYERYARMIRKHLAEHYAARGCAAPIDLDAASWGLVGLGVVADLTREIGSLDDEARAEMIRAVGGLVLDTGRPLGPQRSP